MEIKEVRTFVDTWFSSMGCGAMHQLFKPPFGSLQKLLSIWLENFQSASEQVLRLPPVVKDGVYDYANFAICVLHILGEDVFCNEIYRVYQSVAGPLTKGKEKKGEDEPELDDAGKLQKALLRNQALERGETALQILATLKVGGGGQR